MPSARPGHCSSGTSETNRFCELGNGMDGAEWSKDLDDLLAELPQADPAAGQLGHLLPADLAVEDDHRRDPAGAQSAGRVQGEPAVGQRLPRLIRLVLPFSRATERYCFSSARARRPVKRIMSHETRRGRPGPRRIHPGSAQRTTAAASASGPVASSSSRAPHSAASIIRSRMLLPSAARADGEEPVIPVTGPCLALTGSSHRPTPTREGTCHSLTDPSRPQPSPALVPSQEDLRRLPFGLSGFSLDFARSVSLISGIEYCSRWASRLSARAAPAVRMIAWTGFFYVPTRWRALRIAFGRSRPAVMAAARRAPVRASTPSGL